MVETVLVLPFIMVMIVLIVYLGWNFRRLAQATNLDRYVVWEYATPGAPGPGIQGLDRTIRNPQMNHAFYGYTGDEGIRLDENRVFRAYIPEGHEVLRDAQVDETYSYFDEFLENNPAGIRQRMEVEHPQMNRMLANFGMDTDITSREGHHRMRGDWRYANGVRRYDENQWEAGGYRVSPGSSLREVFFVELDDGLDPYVSRGNELARVIRDFYLSYPGYLGPDVMRRNDGTGTNAGTGGTQ